MLPRPSGIVRYIIVAIIFIFLLYGLSSTTYDVQTSPFKQSPNVGNAKPVDHSASDQHGSVQGPEQEPLDSVTKPGSTKSKQASADHEPAHPIDKLIFDAQHQFAALLSKETKSLGEAAQAYRKRRGRHPPPGFDKWFEYAQSNNALIVEDFFDQIYHDLGPFWGMDPALIRRESATFEMRVNIRDGNATSGSDFFWTRIWLDMIRTVQHLLPDMDLALNPMDEPRLAVPHENITAFMRKAAKTVKLPKAKTVVTEFQKLPEPGTGDTDVELPEKTWESSNPFWPLVRRGCHPQSLARTTPLQDTFDQRPVVNPKNAEPHSTDGFVSNFTLSVDICHQPDLQGLEGVFIEPLSTSTCGVLFPLFGGSKLSVNNEILLPAPMYYNEEERFTGGDARGAAWADKTHGVIWRGVATGGKNRAENWKGFQRHRFVAMNNATTLARVESGEEQPENFVLPPKESGVAAQKEGKLSEWVETWSNVSFTDLSCYPVGEHGRCNYTDHYFDAVDGMPMSQQFDFKYLPDIDGNSFSGRYRGFLKSSSVPVKAALWREWHDSRLVAWQHFVPMDSRFGDYYGIMEYFLGSDEVKAHDNAGEQIANAGSEWADKVLRKEDMQIYVLRLLLEYGRLIDDRREKMGWVQDVIDDPSLESKWKWWW